MNTVLAASAKAAARLSQRRETVERRFKAQHSAEGVDAARLPITCDVAENISAKWPGARGINCRVA